MKNSPSNEQSPTFKLIHGLEEPRKNPAFARPNRQQSYERAPREPAPDDELRFSGLNTFERKDQPRGEVDETSLFART